MGRTGVSGSVFAKRSACTFPCSALILGKDGRQDGGRQNARQGDAARNCLNYNGLCQSQPVDGPLASWVLSRLRATLLARWSLVSASSSNFFPRVFSLLKRGKAIAAFPVLSEHVPAVTLFLKCRGSRTEGGDEKTAVRNPNEQLAIRNSRHSVFPELSLLATTTKLMRSPRLGHTAHDQAFPLGQHCCIRRWFPILLRWAITNR